MAQRSGCSDGGHTNGGALHATDGHLAAIASAHFDDLTGILNRRGLLHRLQIAATEPGWVVAYIDVDRFKTINDSGGHGAGDEALRNVAAAISSTAAEGSIIGRLGGDEFVVASPMTVHPVVVGERIRDGVRQLGGRPTVSIGIARARVGESVDAVLNKADMALRRAKRAGKDRVMVFDQSHQDEMNDRVQTIGYIQWALANDAFDIDIQPIWQTCDGTLVGGECLARMGTPHGDRLRPAKWLAIAEEIGVLSAIDGLVLERSGQLLSQIANAESRVTQSPARKRYESASKKAALFLSINLSPSSVSAGDLSARVEAVIRNYRLARGCLALEFSERTVPSDLEEALPVLHRLRELGVILSLDDFGSGHASLIQMRDLPLDMIKLDRRFTLAGPSGADVTVDQMRAIAGTAVSLASALDLDVVFEGVERGIHLQIAQEVGAKFAQGYHLSRPMPAEDFIDLAAISAVSDERFDLNPAAALDAAPSLSVHD